MTFPPTHLDHEGKRTCGPWTTETESVAAFDQAIANTGMFRTWTEVSGRYQWLRPSQADRTPRIDRILVPEMALIAAGWDIGPIGVECKRSGEKTGPPISQLLDYTRAAWKLNHTWVMPEWYFLWPLQPVKSTLESLFAQQRMGGIYLDYHGHLIIHSRGNIARFNTDGTVEYRQHNTTSGRKTGSR